MADLDASSRRTRLAEPLASTNRDLARSANQAQAADPIAGSARLTCASIGRRHDHHARELPKRSRRPSTSHHDLSHADRCQRASRRRQLAARSIGAAHAAQRRGNAIDVHVIAATARQVRDAVTLVLNVPATAEQRPLRCAIRTRSWPDNRHQPPAHDAALTPHYANSFTLPISEHSYGGDGDRTLVVPR